MIFVIFLQCPAMFHHDLRMGYAHIAEMPRLMGDPGDGLFPWRVSLNEAISCRPLPECLADTLIGEIGAEKVNIRLGQSQVDSKPGLMFAVSAG